MDLYEGMSDYNDFVKKKETKTCSDFSNVSNSLATIWILEKHYLHKTHNNKRKYYAGEGIYVYMYLYSDDLTHFP